MAGEQRHCPAGYIYPGRIREQRRVLSASRVEWVRGGGDVGSSSGYDTSAGPTCRTPDRPSFLESALDIIFTSIPRPPSPESSRRTSGGRPSRGMPKKRHFNRYSKPQSTAPASIASASPNSRTSRHTLMTSSYFLKQAAQLTSTAEAPNRQRGVNELLSDLRRTSTPPAHNHPVAGPSVPPVIRDIFQLPETPAPLPRALNRHRLDARGRRLPPGPAPPRSWQTVTRRDDGDEGSASTRADGAAAVLPGEYVPAERSLVDMLLRLLVREWATLGPLEELGLWALPDRTRQALLRYLDFYRREDVSLGDVRSVLVPDEEDTAAREANAYLAHLHVPSTLLTASTFPSLIALLFPKPPEETPHDEPHETWEAADLTPAPPRQLLPALTHLSLALDPSRNTPSPSWRHLLHLAKKLPGLTHLSLAFWPEPMRTPNARLASVVGPQGNAVQYAGTGFYSHSLDQDWSEAVNILRTLGRRLYQLEYLDVTGCGAWFPALVRSAEAVDGEEVSGVDWVGDWAKVVVVRMGSGVRVTGEESEREKERLRAGVEMAGEVERHVTARRAGKGRIITVERDDPYTLR